MSHITIFLQTTVYHLSDIIPVQLFFTSICLYFQLVIRKQYLQNKKKYIEYESKKYIEYGPKTGYTEDKPVTAVTQEP